MSKYTTEVRFICENYSGLDESVGYSNVEDVIANSRTKVFDFDYPIYDKSYKSVIETKILKHFYTREIGAESVGLWKLWLNTRMNEIMPYYNQLYESALIKFNPMYDTDITTTRKTDGSGSRDDKTTHNVDTESNTSHVSDVTNNGEKSSQDNSSSNMTKNHWQYYSDTPQGGINGLDSNTYLTNATHITDTDNNTFSDAYREDTNNTESTEAETNTESNENGERKTNSEYTNTEDYIEHVTGKRYGESYSKMLTDFRNTFLNIDMKVINELNDLFCNLW